MSPPPTTSVYVRPAITWSGTIPDAEKEKAGPQSGAITYREALDELWAAWDLGGEAPRVNFGSYFVVVVTGQHVGDLVHLMLDADGRGRAVIKGGEDPERQGFGYSIGVFPRAGVTGVKTYRGKDVAMEGEW